MALAYLCRQLQVTTPELDLVVKAFIIDHKAREESSEEASKVSKWLSNLGETDTQTWLSPGINQPTKSPFLLGISL